MHVAQTHTGMSTSPAQVILPHLVRAIAQWPLPRLLKHVLSQYLLQASLHQPGIAAHCACKTMEMSLRKESTPALFKAIPDIVRGWLL